MPAWLLLVTFLLGAVAAIQLPVCRRIPEVVHRHQIRSAARVEIVGPISQTKARTTRASTRTILTRATTYLLLDPDTSYASAGDASYACSVWLAVADTLGNL
jgi:hypothetical protein